MRVIDGVYAYIWRAAFENNCNMYYFGAPLNLLFDIGLKNYVDLRFENMKKDGLNTEEIQYVVNTHLHPDHSDGSNSLKIPVAMSTKEVDLLPDFYDLMGLNAPEFSIRKELEEGKWEIGGTELEIYDTPGHSPGSISIYWPEKKALVCGDLIFDQSIGRTDFSGGDSELIKESIIKISKLDIELLLPGHMNYVKGRDAVKRNFDFIINQYFPLL